MSDTLPEVAELKREVSISDKDNPLSLVNMLPPAMAASLDELLFTNPEYFELDEQELYKYLKNENKQPTPTDNRLRLQFWYEYDQASRTGRKITAAGIANGIVTKEYFTNRIIKSPSKLAWIMCPPTGYMVKANEALEFGLEQLRSILDLPETINGKPDYKLAEIKMKIVTLLDQRVRGAIVQKIESKEIRMNMNVSQRDVKKLAESMTAEEMDVRIKKLQQEMGEQPLEVKANVVTPE